MRKVQMAFIVDTTASMGWLREVLKKSLLNRAKKMFAVFPMVEISLIFIGDDVNPHEKYSVETLAFTRDPEAMIRWMDKVGNSYGGGQQANYALGLRAARSLKWAADSVKLVAVVGDEVPQPNGFTFLDRTQCNWEFEAAQLVNMGCTIDGVHCFPGLYSTRVKPFYTSLARVGRGKYLPQDQFDDFEVVVLARIFNALSEGVGTGSSPISEYETELRNARRMTRSIDQIIANITGRHAQTFAARKDGLQPVRSGQLQVLWANEPGGTDVTSFLNENGFTLTKGTKAEPVKRLYRYDGTRDGKKRKEKVQWYKDIILRDEVTGDFFTGDAVRKILGLPLVDSQTDFEMTPAMIPANYAVFIESTSHNRSLPFGTEVLVDQTESPSSAKAPCRS